NFAHALHHPFDEQGNGMDLDEAIKHLKCTLLLRPAGPPDWASLFDNLARAQRRRFDERGEGNDLDEAIKHHQSALFLRPNGHPDQS
ncbi:hypothetical protein BDN67DRAFT_859239, partial [Paxillus ammoniavirescens]